MNALLPFPVPVPLPKPNALGVGAEGLPNTICGCVEPFDAPEEVLPPDEGGIVVLPKEKTEGFDGAPKGDGFKLSVGLADPLSNNEALGWVLPNATGDPAGVVEKGLFDTPLPNALMGTDVDMIAFGSGALDFPKILLEALFVPKLGLPNTDAGSAAAGLLASSWGDMLLNAPLKPELPNTAAGAGEVALLASSLAVFAAPKMDNGVSFFASLPDAAVANDVPGCDAKENVDLGADEALVEPNAEPPEGPNENLGFSVSGTAALGASEVSAGFDTVIVLLPDPNTDEG